MSAASLLLLAILARLVTRDWLHPAVTFPAAWGLVLLLISVAEPLGYYPVENDALLLFLTGAVAFMAGALGISGQLVKRNSSAKAALESEADINYALLVWACVAIHAVMLPLWWGEVTKLAERSSDLVAIAIQLRIKSTLIQDTESVGHLVGNYLVAGLIVIPLLALGVIRRKLSLPLALGSSIPWIVPILITAGRANLVQLALVLFYLAACTGARFGIRHVFIGLAVFLLIYGAGAVLVEKQGLQVDMDFSELVKGTITNFLDYLLQGPILFSRYFSGAIQTHSTWNPFVFPCELLENFRLCRPGALIQEYNFFGRDITQIGNVYSIYFAIYPEYGWVGVAAFLFTYGVTAGFLHERARRSTSTISAVLSAYLFSAVLLSVFSELFGMKMNFLLKVIVLCALIKLAFSRKARSRSGLTGSRHSSNLTAPGRIPEA